jgi:hypothetical protein
MKKQGYWFKLSFKNKKAWDELYYKYFNPESEDCLFATIQIITARQLGYGATYDEEGEILTEAGVYDDFSVDLISDVEILELEPYLIYTQASYQIGIGSFTGRVMTREFKPDVTWLIADIKDWLDERGTYYTSTMIKADLINLVI